MAAPTRTRYTGSGGPVTGRTRFTGSTPSSGGGGGGFLGGITHAVGAAAHAVGSAATAAEHYGVNTATGLYKIGKDELAAPKGGWGSIGQQWTDLAHGNLHYAQGDPLKQDVSAIAASTKQPFTHPFRDPLNSALTYAALASGGAKLAIAAGEGAKAAEAGSFATRTLKAPGSPTVHPEPSRSGIGQVATKAYDTATQRLAARKPGGRAEALVQRKIGKVVTAEAKQATRVARGPGQQVIMLGHRLKPAEQKALQVVAEEAPLKSRITTASARVVGAKSTTARAAHQKELDLLHKASAHIDDTGAKPVFVGPKAARLGNVLDKMRTVAGDRETLLKNLGLLTDESVQSRKTAAGRVSLGATYEKAAGGIQGQEQFTASPEAIRIPDVATRRGTKALQRTPSVGAQGTIGHPRPPGSVTHAYTGVLREHALRRQDTTRLVGESSLEAAKFSGLKHIVNLVKENAAPAPMRHDDVAVRLDKLKGTEAMPLQVRKFLADPEEHFQSASPAEQASMLDRVRQHIFMPTKNWRPAAGVTPEAQADFERLHAEGKVGWVPKRVLGEIGSPTAPLRAVAPGKAVGTVDAINNAQRFAILYLKPAYAIPNLLGNLALNLIQQGAAAPKNLAQASRLYQRLPKEDYAKIDAVMGEGVARSVGGSQGTGRLAGAVNKAAGGWSRVVDQNFRRASFLHAAREAGFKTPQQISELLNRSPNDADLIQVGIRGNRDTIDYENLGPTEREIIRRVVFFYPWVKGSTVYAGRFLKEHPLQAAAYYKAAQLGQQWSQQSFGPTPSWLEGLAPVGANRAFNFSSVSPFNTPAQVAGTAQGLLSGNIPGAANAASFYSPALSLALAEATRTHPGTGVPYKPGTSALGVAAHELGGSLPQVSLYKGLHGKGSKAFPATAGGALGKFLLGGAYPARVDRAALNAQAAAEQKRLHPGGGPVRTRTRFTG